MPLDVLTPKGQTTVDQERRAAAIFEKAHPQYRYVATPKDKPAVVDALLFLGVASVAAAVETKCREMTLDELMGPFKFLWLVTLDKLERASASARDLQVPLVGFLYLVPDDVLLVRRLTDEEGRLVKMEKRETATQRTVNGGSAVRINAFVSMKEARIYRGDGTIPAPQKVSTDWIEAYNREEKKRWK